MNEQNKRRSERSLLAKSTVGLTALMLAVAPARGQDFQITELSADGCTVVDHHYMTGDDRGGIAVSSTHVFYTGDERTAAFALSDLSLGPVLSRPYDALTSNLRTGGVLYSLGDGTLPITWYGGTVTTLLEIDGATGALTGASIPLSTLIPATNPTGIFAGYDRVVLHTGGNVYDIALPSGVVTNLGAMPAPAARSCESWAYWGVAELFGGSVYLVYRESSGPNIVRTRVPDGLTTTVATFLDLSDMCSFTVSPASERWYFHHEGTSQFGGGYETLGFCSAAVAHDGLVDLSLTRADSGDRLMVDESFSYTLTVANLGPDSATEVRLRHRFPETLAVLAAIPSQGGCTAGSEAVTCVLGTLSVDAGATVTFDVVPQQGGLVTTSATVFSEEIDLDPTNNHVFKDTVALVEDLPVADVSISQIDSPDPVTVGANLTYTLTVANNGPDDLPEVTVLDTLPATVSLVSAFPSQGACDPDRCTGISCALGALDEGEQATVTIEVTPHAAGTIANTASAPTLNDPDPADNQAVLDTTVKRGPTPPIPFSVELYSAYFSAHLRIIDPIAGSTVATTTITPAGNEIHDEIYDDLKGLAAHPQTGELWTFMTSYDDEDEAADLLLAIDPVTGVATLIGDTGDYFVGSAFDADGTLYGVTASRSLYVLDQTNATPTLVLALGGGSYASAIAFNPVDGLLYVTSWSRHEGFRLDSIDLSGPTVSEIDTCGDSIYFASALTHLEGNVMLAVEAYGEGDWDRLFSITGDGAVRLVSNMDHYCQGLAMVADLPLSDLAITQTAAPDPVSVESTVTYTVTVHNQGPNAAPEVTVLETLPGTVSLVAASASQGRCDLDVCGELTCALGELPAGELAEVTIEVTALVAGTITHAARVSSAHLDPDPTNNETVEQTPVQPGFTTPTLLSIRTDAAQLRVVDPSDGSTRESIAITLAGESVEGGNGLATHPLTGRLWALLRLAGQDGRELVTLDPTTGVATHIGDTGDLFAGLAFDASGTLYGVTEEGASTPEALFILSRTDATPSLVLSLTDGSAGEAIAFHPLDGRLYRASGGLTFQAVDPGRPAVTAIPTCSGSFSSATALTHLGGDTLLLAGGGGLYSITNAGRLALIGSMDHGSRGLALVAELSPADLSVTQSDAPDPVPVGTPLTYTLSVANHGPDDVSAVTVLDTLPATVDLVSTSTTQGSCGPDLCGGLSCALGALPGGARATVAVTVTPLAAGTITNTALAPALDDPDHSNNQAVEATTVLPAGSPATLLSVDGSSDQLRVIDPNVGSTLASTNITLGDETVTGGRGLAIHPQTGELWALLALSYRSESELVTLNPATGVARRIGNTGDRFVDLAFDGSGTLYGVTDLHASTPESFHVLSQTDATASFVLSLADGARGEAIAFHPPDGLLYHASGGLTFRSFDPGGPTVTDVPTCRSSSFSQAGALTYLDGNTLLLADSGDRRLYSITPGGVLKWIGLMDHESRGLAFAGQLPFAEVSLTQTAAPDPVASGSILTYTVSVENEGPDKVPDLTVLDTLPGSVSLVSATPSRGVCHADLCGKLWCDLGDVDGGERAAVAIEVTPWAAGVVTNTAVAPAFSDPDLDNNQTVADTTVVPGNTRRILLSIAEDDHRLRVIDLIDGSTLASSTITLAGEAVHSGHGLATHPETGELWALLELAGQDGYELVTLDPTSGVAHAIGDTGDRFVGLTFDPDGNLYAVTGSSADSPESLFLLNQSDASPSFVLSLADDLGGAAIAFNPRDGLLYHVSGGLAFQSVDLNGPTTTEIMTCHLWSGSDSVAVALTQLGGHTFLFVTGYGALHTVTTDGVERGIGRMDHHSNGLAFVDLPFADLSVTQSAAPEPVAAGDRLTYTLTVTNHGPDDVPDVTVSDTLPATVSLVSVSPSQGVCSLEPCRGLVCALGGLDAGDHAAVTLEVTPLAAGTITNAALVPILNDPRPYDNEAALTTTVLPGTAPGTLFSIDRSQPQLRIIDPRDGSTLASRRIALPGENLEGGSGLAAHPITGELWALLRLEYQDDRELVAIQPATGLVRRIGNTGDRFAALTFDAGGTLYGITESWTETPESLFILSQTDATPTFVLSLADGWEGEAIAFNPRDRLLYHASGEGLRWRSVDLSGPTITELATCTVPDFAAGALTHLGRDTFLLAGGGSRSLYAVTAAGGLAYVGWMDEESQGLAFVAGLGFADLSVSQSAWPDSFTVGRNMIYTLTVANDGPEDFAGVTVVDTLPGTVSLNSAVPACRTEACGGISCALGELAAGEQATIMIAVTPLVPGTITNTVSVPAFTDPDPDDNQALLEVTVGPGSSTPVLLSVSDQLRVLDPATGATLSSRSITLAGEEIRGGRGLAPHPETGELWALLDLWGQDETELVTIHPATGLAHRVGTTGDDFISLAFDWNGTLYAVTGSYAGTPESLFILSQTDATPSFVVSLPENAGSRSIAFNPLVRRLYYASEEVTLQAIDLSGPTFTDVAICSSVSPRALTHLGGRTMLLAGSGYHDELYAINTLGGLQRLGTMDHQTGGLAVVDRPLADLALTQTASPDPVTAGGHLTFMVTVANHGPGEAAGVTVFDALPGTVSLISASPSQGVCSAEVCGNLVCALGDLAQGEVVTVTIEVTPLVPGILTHTAFAPALGDPDRANNASALETTVHPGPSTATLLSLDGNSDQLRVIDPSNGSTLSTSTIKLAGANVEGGHGLAIHPVTGELWALLDIEDREGRELVTLSPTAGVAWPIGNTGDDFAGLAFDSEGTLYAVTERWADTPEALFVLSQTDASPTFVLSLADGQDGEAIAFRAADGLLYHASGGLSLRSIDLSGPTITSIASCGSLGRVGALTDLGGEMMLLADSGSLRLYGITTGGGLREVGSIDHRSGGLAFVDLAFADLAVTLTDSPDPVTVGENLTLTLTVTNNGPEEVPDVTVFDTLPGGFDLARISPSQGVCATAPCTEALACALDVLDAGQYATVTIEVTPLVAGIGTNTAFAPALGDPYLENNLATQTTTVLPGASVPTLLSIAGSSDRLRIIDPSDGSTRATITIWLEGETVLGGNGLATDPVSGELWALLRIEGRGWRELVTINPSTGAARRVGNTGDRFAGLAFDSDGILYGVTGRGADTPEALFILSRSDATSTWVLSLADGSGGEAIAFGPADGLLYHASGELAFRAIDLSEATVTTIADCGTPWPAAALTYLGGNTLLLADKGSSLFALTTSGSLTQLGSLDHRAKGLAFVELDLAATFRIEYQIESLSVPRQMGGNRAEGGPIQVPFCASVK